MSLWLLIPLIIYVLVAVGFGIFIYTECRKRNVDFGGIHIIVPLLWPLWGIWYLAALFSEWRVNRAKQRTIIS